MDNKEEYNLYTEKVIKTSKLTRKLKKFAQYIMSTVILSIIAAVVFFEVHQYLEKLSGSGQEPTRVQIDVPARTNEVTSKSPENTEEQTSEEVTSPIEIVTKNNDTLVDGIKVAKESYNALVRVSGYINTSPIFKAEYEKRTMGAVIIHNSDKYYILTDYDVISNADRIEVMFYNGVTRNAEMSSYDKTTGIAILTVDAATFDISESNDIKVLPIANSDDVSNDDAVIAVGNICNGEYTYNTGRVTNISNKEYGLDSMYSMINTSISCGMGYSGVLLNNDGRLIGIITDNYKSKYGENLVNAYAISSLKTLIDHLSNGLEVKTIGIEGVEIKSNGVIGIYITSVQYNSPAYNANIQVGDIITKVRQESVDSFDKFQSLVLSADKSEPLVVTVAKSRDSEYRVNEVTVTFDK